MLTHPIIIRRVVLVLLLLLKSRLLLSGAEREASAISTQGRFIPVLISVYLHSPGRACMQPSAMRG